jgi:FkbM family methyltransferase
MHLIPALLRSFVIYHFRPGRRRRLVEHYAPFVGPDSLVFDVGAHVGNRVRAFAALGARVVAIEPHGDLARLLEWGFRRNDAVAVEQCALGSEEREVELFLSPGNLTVSTTSSEWADRAADKPGWEGVSFTSSATVYQTTLDHLIEKYGKPDFVKIDVEGSEAEVLAGISHPLRALSYEFLPADRDVAYHATMRLEHLASEAGASYSYNFSLGEELRLVMPERWWSADELLAYLREIPEDGPSGDVYARLTGESVTRRGSGSTAE